MARQKKLPVAIDEDEFAKLIQNTKKPKHRIAFLLGYGAGMRVSEVVNLEKRDIDFTKKSIFIRQGKGSKDRIVPLPKGFAPKHMKLIPIGVGARALQYAFRNGAIKSGLMETKPDIHFHSLRHGFATNCVCNGVPIHHIRTMMGHSNISVTNVYLELNPKEALKSYEELF